MSYENEDLVDAAINLGDALGREAAYQRDLSDPQACVDLYHEDPDEWLATYRPTYGPLSGKSGGLTEREVKRTLGLSDITDGDLLERIYDSFEESWNQGWDSELLYQARENL